MDYIATCEVRSCPSKHSVRLPIDIFHALDLEQSLNQNRRSISRQNMRRYIYHFLRPLCEEKFLGEQHIIVRIIYQRTPQTAVNTTTGKVVTQTDLALLHRPAPSFP